MRMSNRRLYIFIIYFLLIYKCSCEAIIKTSNQCSMEDCGEIFHTFVSHSPLIKCSMLDLEFLTCAEPLDLKGNETAREELGYGCTKFGGQKYEDVQFTAVNCTVLSGIECYGQRNFFRDGFPCIKMQKNTNYGSLRSELKFFRLEIIKMNFTRARMTLNMFLEKTFFQIYSGHYFLTTLLYSILLGFLGMDRFCLGHTGTAVGKLLTLGGVGIWWIVDVVLLVTGNLTPEDGSNWVPYA